MDYIVTPTRWRPRGAAADVQGNNTTPASQPPTRPLTAHKETVKRGPNSAFVLRASIRRPVILPTPFVQLRWSFPPLAHLQETITCLLRTALTLMDVLLG